MQLDLVGGFVARLGEVVVELFAPVRVVQELMTAGAAVGREVGTRRHMLIGIRWVQRMNRLRKDGMAADMKAPVIEGQAPGVRAHVGAKGLQSVRVGVVAEER